MPPIDRVVPRFIAEPPQEVLPYGRWAEALSEHFLEAVAAIKAEDTDLGDPGEITWYPDRTYAGRTYVPATAPTSTGLELFGYVSFDPGDASSEPDEFVSRADFTTETAERHPEWSLDLSEEVIGRWRGEQGKVAEITLVWGVPLVDGGALVTAELADLAVDQCPLLDGRFTLVAPDAYRSDLLDIKLWDRKGAEVASESLYEEDDEDDE
jgi:hypothetical protein